MTPDEILEELEQDELEAVELELHPPLEGREGLARELYGELWGRR